MKAMRWSRRLDTPMIAVTALAFEEDRRAALPAGSFREGTLNLLLPTDSRVGPGAAVEPCATPAFVFTQIASGIDPRPAARFEIAHDLVEALNARRLCATGADPAEPC